MKERIGVYVCHCGGNISDYVDVETISTMMKDEDGVVVAKNIMFACADSYQKEMVNDIKENNLDAIVIASCSPKLHLFTFRNMAERAGLNPFNYVQVNIREQCSWPHSDHPSDATNKAVGLIRGGIKKVAHSEALQNIEIEATRSVLVIGAGVSGMRAAIDIARQGNEVFLVEKENKVGGRVSEIKKLFPSGQNSTELINALSEEMKKHPQITLFTNATVEHVSGSLGKFEAEIKIKNTDSHSDCEIIKAKMGTVLVTTGFDHYQPKEGEYGYNSVEGVITLPEFKKLTEENTGKLYYKNKQVKNVAFIYCVGNRQSKGENKYCSRVCCTSAIHTSLLLKEKFENIRSYHFFRDIRTYGKQEILFEKASKQGDVFLKFEEKEPPVITAGKDKLLVKVKDYLTSKKELDLETDLVVLVTGIVARADSGIIAEKLKIPVGNDKFFNEIHPKLKPVETVIKGVFIGGTCQGPKNISESVQSSLSAVSKINALIKDGRISLAPVIARVNPEACVWCGKCAEVCEYDAISEIEWNGKKVAGVNKATCKGCGICTPVCPDDALDVVQYSNQEIESMIDGFAANIQLPERIQEETKESVIKEVNLKGHPKLWKEIAVYLKDKSATVPEIASALGKDKNQIMFHLMTMNKYHLVTTDGLDKKEVYYYYKLKND